MALNQNGLINKRFLMERRALINLILLVIGYIVSWLPYAVLSFLIYFNIIIEINPVLSLIISSIGKLSFIWTSSFYIFSNKNLRARFTFKRKLILKHKMPNLNLDL